MQQGPQIMEEKIASLAGRRNLAMSELDKVENISYIKPQGAFYIFIDLRDALEKSDKFSSTDSLAFAQFLFLIINAFVLQYMIESAIGAGGTFLIFACLNFIGIIFVILFLKETKGLTSLAKKTLYASKSSIKPTDPNYAIPAQVTQEN